MSGQTRRRRPSPAVYRRRRLVLVLVLLLIGAGVTWLLVAQPWRGTAADARPATNATSPPSTQTPTPGTSKTEATDAPTPTGTPADANPTPTATLSVQPCTDADVLVEALTDAETYRSGQNPQLSIRLTNSSSEDCTINVGTTSQTFTITSGSDTWWRSTDCQTEPVDMVVTLAAGQSVTSAAPVVWDRTRSSVSSCGDATRPRAPGGGASYHLTVSIGGVSSHGSRQFLLY